MERKKGSQAKYRKPHFGFLDCLTSFRQALVFPTFVSLGTPRIFYIPVSGIFFFAFLGPHLWLMEVPRLGVELEMELLAYTTATAMADQSRVCNLQILIPLNEAWDRTRILMDTNRVLNPLSHNGNSQGSEFFLLLLRRR